jgi:hypothetical protein
MPSGANGISSGGYDPGLQFPWSRQISTNWTAGGQVAFYWPTEGGKHNVTGETTFYADRQLTKPWDAFVEYAGDFPDRGGTRQILHFGTSYKLAPHHQIDFHVGVGLSSAAPTAFVGFGYSFPLPHPLSEKLDARCKTHRPPSSSHTFHLTGSSFRIICFVGIFGRAHGCLRAGSCAVSFLKLNVKYRRKHR